MKMLKKLLTFLLTLTVAIVPIACNSDGGEEESSSKKQKSTSISYSLNSGDSSSVEITNSSIDLSTITSSSIESSNTPQSSACSSSSETTQSVASSEQTSLASSLPNYDSDSTNSLTQSNISTSTGSASLTQSTSSPQSSVYVEPACAHTLTQTNTVEPTVDADGYREFKCSACQDVFTSPIPKLNDQNYTVTETEATCESAGVITYSSDVYGTFTVEGKSKLQHSVYNHECIRCNASLYDNLDFDQNNLKIVSNTGAGPRMIELQNGDFLVAFDDGTNNLLVTRSSDKGETWETPWPVDTVDEKCLAANTSLYQFDNGDILCAYRVHGDTGLTGSNEQKYVRKIICAISHDNGDTWSYHSTIVDVYQMGLTNSTVNSTIESLSSKWVGVYEPCFGEIDGKLTVMYADDFSSKIKQGSNNHGSQLIQSCTWDPTTETWSEPHTCLDGTVKKSVAGYNVISRDGMPVFDELSDGTVVLVTEGTYMSGADSPNKHPFIICLSYSKDKGQTFSTPVAIFIPRKDNAKGAAPYVCVTDDDRLVISYQTDEDLDSPGYDDPSTPNLNEADAYSVMKVIISDGTPIDKITGPENFLDSVNVFGTPRNYGSSWNGMMLSDDTIYCLTGTGWNMDGGYGIQMQSSKIPTYPEWTNYPSCEDEIFVRNGSVSVDKNCITTTSANTLITHTTKMYNGTVSVDVVPNVAQDVALIFRANSPSDSTKYWETDISYYLFMINYSGEVFIAKINNGWTEIITSQRIRNTYDPTKGYSIKVELNDDVMTCYLDDEMILSYKDENLLTGTSVGVRAATAGAMFYNLTATPKS